MIRLYTVTQYSHDQQTDTYDVTSISSCVAWDSLSTD